MKAIDRLHLEAPYAGSRMRKKLLRAEGFKVGRRHVRTLMRTMGVEALYRKKNTSRRHPGHEVFSVSAWRSNDHRGQSSLGARYHVHPDGPRLRLFRRRHGLGDPENLVLAALDDADDGLLCRGAGGRD